MGEINWDIIKYIIFDVAITLFAIHYFVSRYLDLRAIKNFEFTALDDRLEIKADKSRKIKILERILGNTVVYPWYQKNNQKIEMGDLIYLGSMPREISISGEKITVSIDCQDTNSRLVLRAINLNGLAVRYRNRKPIYFSAKKE